MKMLFLFAVLSFTFCKYSNSQILCIQCYNQNDSISSGVNNLLQNGSFENGCINGSFCPNSQYYTCDIPDWACSGGGTSTYAQVFDINGAWYGGFLSEIVFGQKAVYLGNFYCNAPDSIEQKIRFHQMSCPKRGFQIRGEPLFYFPHLLK